MKEKINTYMATLLITIAGAGAALLLIHTAEITTVGATTPDNEASYDSLKNTILQQ